jgi:DNA-binding NarL/FixJ family response regulator
MKVMLVDDHSLFLEGLKYLLETHEIDVVAVANNGKEALQKAMLTTPDIILMDINMPDWTGLDILKWIKTNMPRIKVIMLTSSDDNDYLLKAINNGASGYVTKNTDADNLIKSLNSAYKGNIYFSPNIMKNINHNLRLVADPVNTDKNDHINLTSRQMEILQLVSKGISYKVIGMNLGISERTVKYHMGRIIECLQVENKAEVIAYAVRLEVAKKT